MYLIGSIDCVHGGHWIAFQTILSPTSTSTSLTARCRRALEIELWSTHSAGRQRESGLRFDEALRSAGGRWSSDRPYPKSPTKPCWWICRPLRSSPSSNDRKCRLRSATASCSSGLSQRLCFPRPWRLLVPAAKSSHRRTTLPPIAAVFDGVPVQRHRLLDQRLRLHDPDALDALSVVSERRHGTEMASLVIHGDRNVGGEPSLPRPLYFRPVLFAPGNGSPEQPQSNRLLIDTIYRAVRQMKIGDSEAVRPRRGVQSESVLGDKNRPFTGPMSRGPATRLSRGTVRHPLCGQRRQHPRPFASSRLLRNDRTGSCHHGGTTGGDPQRS